MTSEDFQTHNCRNPDADMILTDPEPVIADSYSLSDKLIAAVGTMKPENERIHSASVQAEIDQTHPTEIHEIAPKDEIVHKKDIAINRKNLVDVDFSTQRNSKTRYPRITCCADRGAQNDVEKRALSMANQPFSIRFPNGRRQAVRDQKNIRVHAMFPDAQSYQNAVFI